MALPVVFRRKVGRDLATGFGYYEEQTRGLANSFLARSMLHSAHLSAIRRCLLAFTARCAERSFHAFHMGSSIASSPSVSLCSRCCTRRAIRRSGPVHEGLHANSTPHADAHTSAAIWMRAGGRDR